jgi:hypothetical protein
MITIKCSKKEYHKESVIGILISYFSHYTKSFTKPTMVKFIWMCIGIIAMTNIRSISFMHEWFLKKVSSKSLNSYYYLLSYVKIDLKHLMQTTVKIALSCIPKALKSLSIFIVIDDTLQAKFGVNFECRKKLFDHTKRNGSNFLNGHSFVGLILKIPVYIKNKEIYYLRVSIGYRLKKEYPNKTKLQIASEMIEWVMEILKNYKMVIICCDSWYPKAEVLETVMEHDNLELIANVRVDSVLNDLLHKPTGKKGRLRKKGKRLDVHNQEDFDYNKVGEYFIATRKVKTNLFNDNVVHATVTTPDLDKPESYRLFLSTVMPEELEDMIPIIVDDETKEEVSSRKELVSLLPYILYKFRWPIEVVFYEQKTFWSFGKYMLRSATGIQNYVNLINICYTCMLLLPWKDENFADLKTESPQHIKCVLGQYIHNEIFFASFVSEPESTKKYWDSIMAVISKILPKRRYQL